MEQILISMFSVIFWFIFNLPQHHLSNTTVHTMVFILTCAKDTRVFNTILKYTTVYFIMH